MTNNLITVVDRSSPYMKKIEQLWYHNGYTYQGLQDWLCAKYNANLGFTETGIAIKFSTIEEKIEFELTWIL